MTLIAAIPYIDGVVVCADSQETVDDHYRVSVRKIKPRECNEYELIVGGSGDIGALIDGQARAIEEAVKKWPSGAAEEDCRIWLEGVLAIYTAEVVMLYPAELTEKTLRFVVCVRDKTSRSIYLWKTEANVVEPTNDHILIGWKEYLYEHEAKRLYAQELSRSQATVLGLHLMSLGAATSNYIGGPFQVIVMRGGGYVIETESRIESLEKRIKRVNDTISKLIISTPDFLLSDETFEKALTNFRDDVMGLRREVKQHALEFGDSLSFSDEARVRLNAMLAGNVAPVFVPESPLYNPRPKQRKKSSKRKRP